MRLPSMGLHLVVRVSMVPWLKVVRGPWVLATWTKIGDAGIIHVQK